MSVVGNAVRGVGRTASRAAEVTTEAAGAVGGAAVNGVVGGVQGVAAGVQRGLKNGSHSTPAAALTLGALGVTGLIEWPVLLAVGAGALVLRRLNQHPDATPAKPASVGNAPVRAVSSESTAAKATSAKPANSTKASSSTNTARSNASPTKRTARAKKTAARAPRGSQSRRTP